ncbi:hypothetical protein VE03_09549 [Pseudogymnoascus sp. 23342-1-I1]|nr:hypothetical protein VE03_09549 [Pseudogymnoascus sp. 23342-1-I1]
MSPSTSQSLPTGKDPPGSTTTITRPSSIASPRLPYASLEPSQAQEAQQAFETMPARPPFSPFFTLIDDASTSSTHHPINVRYIFSDDDDQDLTDDFLAAISGEPSPQSSSHIMHSSSSITSSSQRPSARDTREPEHRTIIVDLDATGTAVAAAHSLSSSWQVLSASVTKAPTWESGPTAADNSEEDGAAARFMLRLEGVKGRDERMRERVRGVWREGGEVRAEDFQVLVEEFERKMRVLRTVVETGRDALGVEEGEDGGEDGGEGEHEHEHEGEVDGEGEKDGQGE